MRKVSFYVICLALMLCFWAMLKYLIKGISPDFGDGFFVGMSLTIFLAFVAEKLGYKEPRY